MLGSSGSLNMSLLPNAGTLRQNRAMRIATRLFHQTADGRPRDAVLLGNLRQRHAGAAVSYHLFTIHIEPRTTDLPSFGPSASHAATYSLDEQRSFHLSQYRHDAEERTSQRARRVECLPQRHELHAARIEFIKHPKEMLR